MRPGDKVRIMNLDEITADDQWLYDPTGYPGWKTWTGHYLDEIYIGQVLTVREVDLVNNYIRVEESPWSIPIKAVAEIVNRCECGQAKFNFMGHMKFCPQWTR